MSLRPAFKEDYSVIIDTGWYNSPAILAINHDQKWYKCWRNKTKEWFEEKYVFSWKDCDWSRKQSQSWVGLDSNHNVRWQMHVVWSGRKNISQFFCGGSVPSQPIPSWCCLPSSSNASIHLPLPTFFHSDSTTIEIWYRIRILEVGQWVPQKQLITTTKRIQRGKRNMK